LISSSASSNSLFALSLCRLYRSFFLVAFANSSLVRSYWLRVIEDADDGLFVGAAGGGFLMVGVDDGVAVGFVVATAAGLAC